MAEKTFFDVWKEESPASMQGFFDFAHSVQVNCGLEPKWFQLVYIALQASRGAVGSVAAHTGYAKAAGATRDEVKGVILTTLMAVGINGVADCLPAAMAAYDAAPDAPEK